MNALELLKKWANGERDFHQANLSEANLSNANLSGANFVYADLSDSVLRGATLNGAKLGRAYLNNANLVRANLSNTNLDDAHLRYANLRDANLNGANLYNADLSYADLSGADLSNVYLFGANLVNANLNNTNLCDANLNEANLSRARLNNCNLKGTDLREANLERTDLSGAKGLINAAQWLRDNFTITPEGLIVYKAFGNTPRPTPSYWKIIAGEYLEETVNPLPTCDCTCGVSFATVQWIVDEYKSEIGRGEIIVWECLIEILDIATIVVPYMTDGKARCGKLRLKRIVEPNKMLDDIGNGIPERER